MTEVQTCALPILSNRRWFACVPRTTGSSSATRATTWKSPACWIARRLTADGLRSQEDRTLRPRRGHGAYWGYKWEAKKESNRIRRENAKREIRGATIDVMPEESIGSPWAASILV